MAYVKQYAVFIRIVYTVNRHGQLHSTQTGGKMPSGFRYAVYEKRAYLAAETRNILCPYRAQIVVIVDRIQYIQNEALSFVGPQS